VLGLEDQELLLCYIKYLNKTLRIIIIKLVFLRQRELLENIDLDLCKIINSTNFYMSLLNIINAKEKIKIYCEKVK
jgi:hypothetical protein